MELDLDAHEQLDEIDLRTNSDGTVQVNVLGWEKRGGSVDVTYRVPTGEEITESMSWPKSKDTGYKFIRFINATPYTLRTAEEINEEDDLWLNARQVGRGWELDLPEEQSLVGRLSEKFDNQDTAMTLLKLTLWPLTMVGVATKQADHDMFSSLSHRSEYDNSPFEDEEEHKRALDAFKYTCVTVSWIFVFMILVSMLL